ncbi:MAG: ATP-dependent DNA ligase [Rhodospirillales bacterium]|nr:MAG: ATP-dependent DNA ligase [Rhodospirillales bacterium]
MTDLTEILSQEERGLIDAAGRAEWRRPMLATLTDKRFSDPDWIFERKFDGERALAVRAGETPRLLTRNQKDISATYPELIDILAEQTCDDVVLDGEIVAFDDGVTSFSRLQQRMQISDPKEARSSPVAVYYYVFDILHLNGYGLERLPLRRRKVLLKQAIGFDDRLRFTPHRNTEGEAYFAAACKKGWEGVIAKRADGAYRHGRSSDWLKFKCARGQELVIGGFTKPQGSRIGFGALLVGYYEDGELRYAGKVGTGYDDDFLATFRERLDRLRRETSPFAEEVNEKDVTWVSPRFVGEFGFTEWTRDGKLRHPRFLGLRDDKEAGEVVREEPAQP